MPRFYSDEFKRDAVAFYENSELSLAKASADLGVNRQSLHAWVKSLGTGKRSRVVVQKQQAQAISEAERIRKLERELRKVTEERDILRKAVKYFAEETNW